VAFHGKGEENDPEVHFSVQLALRFEFFFGLQARFQLFRRIISYHKEQLQEKNSKNSLKSPDLCKRLVILRVSQRISPFLRK
jgi:hypothetical protein